MSYREWIEEVKALCQPNQIHHCDGSKEEFQRLAAELEKSGTWVRLNPQLRPNSFLACSTPDDVARVEETTYICSRKKEEAGPTNHWREPEEMKRHLLSLFKGSMRGRTLYVIPFCMGPPGSPSSRLGVQITDSAYVVCNMHIMARVGVPIPENKAFVKCLHSVGYPLREGVKDIPWPCDTKNRALAHFPEERLVWSYGSGYGGNALMSKKCFALRIGSVMGREEGWLAEHMLIMGITNPEGKKRYIAAAFPSACGKTNLAMLTPTLPGWKVETVGDDIAWLKFHEDGSLYAINPETGFFGVAPGTSMQSNQSAMESMRENSIFTNVALTTPGDVWWEGMTKTAPPIQENWLKHPWKPGSEEKAAHPNSRFTAPCSQCPVIDPEWQNPKGVPISAIIFGGRRSNTIPLVFESFNWSHGVFLGASLSSEMTAAQAGTLGKLRHDPFAMLPFCGYNMGDYFAHWLREGSIKGRKCPKIYGVNWFRKDGSGNYFWPGFGENSRVLRWIFERAEGSDNGKVSPVGILPKNFEDPTKYESLFSIIPEEWREEVKELEEYFTLFGDHLPKEIANELTELKRRLS